MRKRSQNSPLSAEQVLSRGQKVVGAVMLLLIATGLVLSPYRMLQGAVASVIAFYVAFVGLKLTVAVSARRAQEWLDTLSSLTLLSDEELPKYAVFVPMRGEAKGVGILAEELMKFDYPTSKLLILFLLDEDDTDTIDEAEGLNLPSHFKILVVPRIGPGTKPKVCNAGFEQILEASEQLERVKQAGYEHSVIYDAEDRNQAKQPRLAATAFAYLAKSPETADIGCLQAELAFWNPTSLVGRFLAAEYTTHFKSTLPGLAALGLIPPLGGTSNHFRMEALMAVAELYGEWRYVGEDGRKLKFRGPWDPSNVTEDMGLAGFLAAAGWRTHMLPAVTFEKAPEKWRVAYKQRSRWLKGAGQTWLVFLRKPVQQIRDIGFRRWAVFELLTGGTFIAVLLNPITWLTTLLYIVAWSVHWDHAMAFFHGLFPSPVYYVGVVTMVVGNFLFWYQQSSALSRQQAEYEGVPDDELSVYARKLRDNSYGNTLTHLLTPFWWAFTVLSGYRALWQLLFSPDAWDKTPHDNNLDEDAALVAES